MSQLELSSEVVRSPWVGKVARRTIPLRAFSLGGAALDTQLNPNYQWIAESDGSKVWMYREDQPDTLFQLFSEPGIEYVSFTFDQSMRPHIAYVVSGVTRFWWYDTVGGGMTSISYPGTHSPGLVNDDLRPEFSGISDVHLVYMKGRDVYSRVQRERYQTERLLAPDIGSKLIVVGLAAGYRVQWKFQA